jgi:hypothetical protein
LEKEVIMRSRRILAVLAALLAAASLALALMGPASGALAVWWPGI